MQMLDIVNQGGVTRTYTVGRSATAVKLLTREILSLTLDLLLYLSLTFDFLDFLPSLVLHLKSCIPYVGKIWRGKILANLANVYNSPKFSAPIVINTVK